MAAKAADQLANLARPLRPVKAPWYVRHPLPPGLERSFPADGWYWIPAGAAVAVFLARSFEGAAHELRTLVEHEEREAA